jgi:hypothetical protein
MTQSFRITEHAKIQLEKKGILPKNCSFSEARKIIYSQISTTNEKYESLRSIIYFVNNIEYIFAYNNELITAIKH